ncbi:hypothetical protein P3T18_006131 [Paraburkholderia sp. GAS199]|uniref:hypothetical protein n=1 Tax=Paraburkholderia sp. GAS199 TaxID=3035126 RepID=UPI003D1DA24C
MNLDPSDAFDPAHRAEIEAQLCAYNAAFDELGLRFRWDAGTLVSLVTIDGEQARIAAYIETHHAHLLNAYSAEFLSAAILAKKNARYPACLNLRVGSASPVSRTARQASVGGRESHAAYGVELPALAGV